MPYNGIIQTDDDNKIEMAVCSLCGIINIDTCQCINPRLIIVTVSRETIKFLKDY